MIARAAADRLHRPVLAIAFPGSRNHQIVDCGMTSSGGTVPPTIIAIAAAQCGYPLTLSVPKKMQLKFLRELNNFKFYHQGIRIVYFHTKSTWKYK